jgi:hypothetical protein
MLQRKGGQWLPQKDEGQRDPPDIAPIIEGLLKRLPKSGDVWPEADQKLWLQLFEGSFKLIYKDKVAITPPPGDEEYQKRKTTFSIKRGCQLRR